MPWKELQYFPYITFLLSTSGWLYIHPEKLPLSKPPKRNRAQSFPVLPQGLDQAIYLFIYTYINTFNHTWEPTAVYARVDF